MLHNSCRHRGAKLCNNDKGKAANVLVCPYHQWTFKMDGQFRMTRVALSEDAVSYTMDAKPAVNQRVENSGLAKTGALLYFHYPNKTINVR